MDVTYQPLIEEQNGPVRLPHDAGGSCEYPRCPDRPAVWFGASVVGGVSLCVRHAARMSDVALQPAPSRAEYEAGRERVRQWRLAKQASSEGTEP